MKRLIIPGLLLLIWAFQVLSLQAADCQIFIKVPVTVTDSLGNVIEQHSHPDSVLAQAREVDSLMGQIIVNNPQFTIFGCISDTHLDTVAFNLLKESFPDIEVKAIPLADQ